MSQHVLTKYVGSKAHAENNSNFSDFGEMWMAKFSSIQISRGHGCSKTNSTLPKKIFPEVQSLSQEFGVNLLKVESDNKYKGGRSVINLKSHFQKKMT